MDQAAFTHLPPQHGLAQQPTPASYLHAGPSHFQSQDRAAQSTNSVDQASAPTPATSASAASLAPGTRPARSRRQRPCDSCRTAKRRCFKDDHAPCVACQATGSACTFLEPPHKRSRLAAGGEGAGSASEGGVGEKNRNTSGSGTAKSRKRPAPTVGTGDDDDEDEDDEDDGHRSVGSAGPGPRTQRMALEQVLNADLPASNGEGPSGSGGRSRRPSAGPPQGFSTLSSEDTPSDPRVMMPAYPTSSYSQGPLARILNRARVGGPDYDQSERSTSHQESSLRQGQSPPAEESDLSHPGLDHSRLAASEPHFSAASAAEDPSLNFVTSRVREVASSHGAGAGNNKIFFVSAPSLIYPKRGPGAAPDPSGGIAPLIRSLELLGKEHPEVLLETFVNITLPAIPLINLHRFYHHLRSYPLSEALYPSRILTGILAHSIMYNPELRAKQTEVWVEVYETLTHEFLQPRLQTIQLTLLDLISRPDKNPGGNSIALARAVGAAQLLGLHLDCSTWQLPRWEKNLRKRLFWLLFVMDKWSSLYQGRPPHIHSSQYNVPFLTLDDFDSPHGPSTPAATASPSHAFSPASSQHNGQTMTQAAIDSAHSFIALTKLSAIVEELTEEFFSVKAQNLGATSARIRASRAGRQQKLRVIESFGADLDTFQNELPARLRLDFHYPPGENPSTGIKSMQLSYLGLTIALGRLTGDLFDILDEEGDFEAPLSTGLDLTDQVIQFLERLTPTDLTAVFWISFTPYHLSNAMSLLIRCLLACRRIGHTPLLVKSIGLLRRFIVILKEHHRPPFCWDLAERALAKLLSLMPSVSRLCPEVGQVWAEHSDEIWAQMRASPTAEVLVSSIPNGGHHAPPPIAPPQPASDHNGAFIPPPPPQNSSLSMRPPSHPATYSDLPGRKPLQTVPNGAPASHGPRQPIFEKPEDVEQYFSSILNNPVTYQAVHGIQSPAGNFSYGAGHPAISRLASAGPLGVPNDRAFPSTDEFSFETPFEIAVGDEDVFATMGNHEGFQWMGDLGSTM